MMAGDLREDVAEDIPVKGAGHSLWALSFMDPATLAVEETCLPNKQEEIISCHAFFSFYIPLALR